MNNQTYIDIQPQNDREPKILKSINRKFITPMASFSLMVNVLFGTGPIYLPGVFLGAGWLLSSIFIIIIAFLSWQCADFVMEAMSNYHAIKALEGGNGPVGNVSNITTQDTDNNQNSLLPSSETEPEDVDARQSDLDQEELDAIELDKQNDREMYQGDAYIFKYKGIAEFGEMAQMLFGKWGNISASLILAVYLIGVLISKCIASSDILSEMFEGIGDGIPVMNNYFFWLAIFCTAAVFLSFKDIAGIKSVQIFIVIFRFFVIFLLILGPIIEIAKNGGGGLTPKWYNPDVKEVHTIKPFHFQGFEAFFSTAIFGLLCHHSIPSMMSNVAPVKDIKKVSTYSFLLGCVMFLVIPILGIIAFQGKMLDEDNINIFTNNFKGSIDWIYYITSFYMFLNIAAFPIIVITTRNNLIKCFMPDRLPKKSWQLTKHTVIMTVVVVFPIILLSIVAKEHIHDVINVVGGVFGVFLMMLIPATLCIYTRKTLKEKGIDLSKNPHRCTLHHDAWAWVTNVLGVICLVYNIYSDIAEWTGHGTEL